MTGKSETGSDGAAIYTESSNTGAGLQPGGAGKAGAMTMSELCRQACGEEQFSFTPAPDSGRPGLHGLFLGFRGKTHNYRAALVADDPRMRVLFYVVAPELIPPAKRSAVMEFLTRANYGLTFGNFELDMTDGEVRFKNSVDFTHTATTVGAVKRLISTALANMNRYHEGIVQILYGTVTPADAIGAIER